MEPFRTPVLPTVAAGTEPTSYLARLLLGLKEMGRRLEGMPFNKSEEVTVADSGTADVEFSGTHHLGRVPEGFLVTKINKAGVVYQGTTAWTTTAVYLKCSVANAAVTLRVF
jgi:hypothetical protein